MLSPDTNISIQLIITVISVGIGLYGFFRGYKRDAVDSEKTLMKVSLQLDGLVDTMNELKGDSKVTAHQITDLTTRIGLLEHMVKKEIVKEDMTKGEV